MKKIVAFVFAVAVLAVVALSGDGRTLADQSPICPPDQWNTACLPWRATPPPATSTPGPARESGLSVIYLPMVGR